MRRPKRVFISYSRSDSEVVRALHRSLEAENREVWVDWADIQPSAEWMAEIRTAIDAADAVLCVLSEDFVASRICQEELAHAVERGKRLIPVVCRDVEDRRVPPALAKLNYVFARANDDAAGSLARLRSALDADFEHVAEHTRLVQRAVQWQERAREASHLLRGGDLVQAESWLARAASREPPATTLHTEYVLSSRRDASKRQRRTLGAVAMAVLVAVALVLGLRFQALERARAQRIGDALQAVYEAETTRDIPGQLAEAHRAGTRALAVFVNEALVSPEADLAVRRSLALLPTRRHTWELDVPATWGARDGAAFAHDGRSVLWVTQRGPFGVYDLSAQRWRTKSDTTLASLQSYSAFAISADGDRVALALSDANGDQGEAEYLALWSAGHDGWSRHENVPVGARVAHLSFSGAGRYLTLPSLEAQLWDVAQARWLPLGVDHALDAAVSADGRRLAVLFREVRSRQRFVQITDLQQETTGEPWAVARAATRLAWLGSSDAVFIVTRHGASAIHQAADGSQLAAFTSGGDAQQVQLVGEHVAWFDDPRTLALASRQAPQSRARLELDDAVIAAYGAQGEDLLVLDGGARVSRWQLPVGGAFTEWQASARVQALHFAKTGQQLGVQEAEPHRGSTTLVLGSAPSQGLAVLATSPVPAPRRWQLQLDGQAVWLIDAEGERRALDVEGESLLLGGAVTADGEQLVLARGESTRAGMRMIWQRWQRSPLTLTAQLSAPPSPSRLESFAVVSEDGRWLVTAHRDWLNVRDWETGAATRLYHRDVARVASDGSGDWLASLDQAGEVRLWQLEDATLHSRLELDGPAEALALSEGGRWLATALGPRVRVFAMQARDLLVQARAVLGPDATGEGADSP